MNNFIATVNYNGLIVDYEVFAIGKKFKGILKQKQFGKYIPCQLDFWKEKGIWKSYHPLTQEMIDQFGRLIDNNFQTQKAKDLENPPAA